MSDHAEDLQKLAAAKTAEKAAAKLRREGRDAEAIAAYVHARELYDETDLAWHGRGESELAAEVRRAMARCMKSERNIRNPKEQRSPAITARPDCLDCGKPLRRFSLDGQTFDDGTPREWGDYGDNRFHGLRCGWNWACRHAPMPKVNT